MGIHSTIPLNNSRHDSHNPTLETHRSLKRSRFTHICMIHCIFRCMILRVSRRFPYSLCSLLLEMRCTICLCFYLSSLAPFRAPPSPPAVIHTFSCNHPFQNSLSNPRSSTPFSAPTNILSDCPITSSALQFYALSSGWFVARPRPVHYHLFLRDILCIYP